MIEDLLAIGWTADIPISTKFSHGHYTIQVLTSDEELRKKSSDILDQYLDRSVGM